MTRYGLRDDQWERIKDWLPGRIGHVGATAQDNRRFVEAVLYRYRAGIPWRDLPPRFGDWKKTHRRFSRWAKTGVGNKSSSISPPMPTTSMRCSTAPSCGRISTASALSKKDDDQAIGRSRGGLSTKIHALVDALGNPLAFRLTADRHTISSAPTRCCRRWRPIG